LEDARRKESQKSEKLKTCSSESGSLWARITQIRVSVQWVAYSSDKNSLSQDGSLVQTK